MTTYSTGNPLGSSDPRDLYDNAENLDNFVNGDQPAYDDRLGQARKSWAGMEQDFADFISASGYQFLGDYAPGIEITAYNQIIRDGGDFWRVSAGTDLPYTTTGDGMPEGGAFVSVGDAVLRQDLGSSASGQGASLVSMESGESVEEALSQAQTDIDRRTIYVGSVAELEALSPVADQQASLSEENPGMWEFSDADLSAEVAADPDQDEYIAPASDSTGASGAWVKKWGGVAATQLAADLDAISESGDFYADGSTLNSPYGLSGTIDSIVVDANTATQRFVSTDASRMFFRFKSGGTFQTWHEISAAEISTEGWPTIAGDNLISEIDTGTASGWALQNGNTSLTSDGSRLRLTTTSAGTVAAANRTVSMTASGDFIMYLTLSAQSVSGSYVNVQLGGPGDGRLIISLGYNWVTGSPEQNRISAAFGSELNGIAGPTGVDFTVPVELALLYNDEFQSGTLFVKISGEWHGYGVVRGLDVYRNAVRVLTGGDHAADLFVHELFIAKPNIVSIGDSITEGATLYAPDYAEGLTNYSSTWQRYANIYPYVRNNIIVNKGIGSQNSSQIDSRVNGIMADAQPQVVFLQASANDFGAGFALSQRTTNIQSSINKITGAGAKVALLNAIYPNADSGAIFPAAPDYYREWWETELDSITGASIKIDWMEGSGILSGGTYMDTTFTQADGVHPTPTGYGLLGNYIQSLEP